MSHLAHTVKLKTALLAAGITDPNEQKAVVENAYVRALLKYLFTYEYVFNGFTKEAEAHLYNRLSKWNEISPINGPLIVERLKAELRGLRNDGLAGGTFRPVKNALGDKYEELNCEYFKGLMDWLFNESVTGND